MLRRRIRDLERLPANLQQLEAALRQIWNEIPQERLRACINMHERLQAVIQRKGGHTHY